jgi:hypothetical protein
MSELMNIYECQDLVEQIEAKAEANDGDVSDEDLEALVKAQTASITQLEKLANYVRYMEGFCSLAKLEADRLTTKRRMVEHRIESVKRFLRPYLQEHGPIHVGTHRLSLRKSEGVVLAEGFYNPKYGKSITTFTPDKKAIKKSIKDGIEVEGAMLEERLNVQIK